MDETPSHRRYPVILFAIFLVLWLILAIRPLYREDWLLENYLVFAFVPLLVLTYRRFRLSNVSYTLIFAFMTLHIIGAHYTYAEVPFGFWLQELLGLSRNHFDRIVHFSFGFLMAYPVREVFLRLATTKGIWGYWFPLELTLAFSCIFEVFEWAAVMLTDPKLGSAYLGTQGDEWDAQKDMALAGLGALLDMMVIATINWRYNRRFVKEIEQSFTVKGKEPLGEVKLAEMKAELLEDAQVPSPVKRAVRHKRAQRKS